MDPAYLFLVSGAIALFTVWLVTRAHRSRRWPTTTGRIATSELDYGDGSYDVRVTYAYEIEGRQYLGKRVRFALLGFNRSKSAQRVIERYPAGSEVPVHYDPRRPSSCTLEPRVDAFAVFLLVLTVGLTLLVALYAGRASS